ncbi:hypothetical protein JHK82_043273 [Glycine max]|nr:hypothetical protein JHK82_043273 [Glycine max]
MNVGFKLQRQVENNRVIYNARGTFKVRFNNGLVHLSYSLYSTCQIEMPTHPAGIVVPRQCITNRSLSEPTGNGSTEETPNKASEQLVAQTAQQRFAKKNTTGGGEGAGMAT